MYAIEFETQLENGAIQIPAMYQKALTGFVKVIILKEETAESAALWSPEIMAFQGIPDMPNYESYRSELIPPQAHRR